MCYNFTMKQKVIVSCFTLLISILLLTSCGTGHSPADPNQAALDNLLAARWTSFEADKPNFGGGVALYIISPKGTYYVSAGLPGGTKDLHFRAASITKTFTASSIMLLQQQGKLNIDDLITATIPGSTEPYVPNTPEYDIPNNNQITIKLLLKHRAGVFDVTNDVVPSDKSVPYAGWYYQDFVTSESGMNHQFTFDELVSVDATCSLSYGAPDSIYHYSNTGYNILGKIIERVSGKSYGQYVHDNFVVPDGLTETTFPYLGDVVAPAAPYATGYRYENQTLTDVSRDNMSVNVAEGNVVSTPYDLANWIKGLIRGQAGLSAGTVYLMTSEAANANAYGLGLATVRGLGYGHNGAHNGYLTSMYYDPKQDVTMVITGTGVDEVNMLNEVIYLLKTCWEAKNLLGYSTAEVF